MSRIAVEQLSERGVRAILALLAELSPETVMWKGQLTTFLADISKGPIKAKTVQVDFLTDAFELQICITGEDRWSMVVDGKMATVEQFAHLLCTVCGPKKEVVVDGRRDLSAEQATML